MSLPELSPDQRLPTRDVNLISLSERQPPIIAEGAHAIGAQIIKPALNEWQAKHPDELVCFAHVGEPEGSPMPEVIASIGAALSVESMFDYETPQGYPPLMEAIAEHLNRRGIYPWEVQSSDIIITPGSKMAGIMSARAVLNPGDNAAASELIYPGHAAGIIQNGGRIVPFRVDPDNDYHHDPQQMADTLAHYQPRLIWVCNPGNPDGLVYTPEEAQPIIDYMKKNPKAVIIQDIIYKDLVYGGNKMLMFSTVEEIADRVITNDGASKGPRATGLRIGCIVVPRGQTLLRDNLVAQANAYFAGTPRLISHGLIPAFQEGGDQDIERYRLGLQAKRDAVVTAIKHIPGLQTNRPQGAFYALINTEGIEIGDPELSSIPTSSERFFLLALRKGVGVLPTSAFGSNVPDIDGNPVLRPEIAETTVRWSFGGPLEPQLAGLKRLYHALSEKE